MTDYRIPVEFTAVLVIPENHGDPAFASISNPDVRSWLGNYTFGELIAQDSRIDPLDTKMEPGLYHARCVTACHMDEVFVDILSVTKQ